MGSGGEGLDVVADFCQEAGCDLDANSWHRHQDLGKRVRIQRLLEVTGAGAALSLQPEQLFGPRHCDARPVHRAAAIQDGTAAGSDAREAPTLEPVDISRHAAAASDPGMDERYEDRTEGKTMSTKTGRTAEEGRGQALSTWAETEMDIDPPGPRSRFVPPDDEVGRTMLEEALGGPTAQARALGGRPTLDPAGAPSREQ